MFPSIVGCIFLQTNNLLPNHILFFQRIESNLSIHCLGGPPRVSVQPGTINLKEGQRMIVQYTVAVCEFLHFTRVSIVIIYFSLLNQSLLFGVN